MSFSSLVCDHCDLSHWQVPQLYFRDESGEMEILMYPMGSESFTERLGYPASEAVRNKRLGQIDSWYCQKCQHTSSIPDADEKQCQNCGNQSLIDLSSLEGRLCPKCGIGKMSTREGFEPSL